MSTYEYVVRQRSYKDGLAISDIESVGEIAAPPPITKLSVSDVM